MMIRSFLPVGQGAFYLEQFNGYGSRVNVVYDCGSSTGINHVKREIEANLHYKETIHAIFISHLDNDHINGIQYLLEYCNVQNIFLPLITENDKKIILLRYLLESEQHSEDDFFYRFVSDTNSFREFGEANIYYVDRYDPDNDNYNRGEGTYPDDQNRIRINTRSEYEIRRIHSIIFNENKSAEGLEDIWLYVPFNFRQQYRVKPLIEDFEKEFGRSPEDIDIHDIFRDSKKIARLRSVFSKVKGSLNSNSMTLFSGTTEPIRQFLPKSYCDTCFKPSFCYKYNGLSGCLYTGDYDASKAEAWKALYEAYKDYWKYIGCIQIPHHGSIHNYNNNFTKLAAYHVVSAGYNNRYNHPHAEVVKDFLYNRLFLNVVSEQEGSVMRLIID